MRKRTAIGIGKTLAAFIVFLAIALAATSFDGVTGTSGIFLGYAYGAVAGYTTVGVAIMRRWVVLG